MSLLPSPRIIDRPSPFSGNRMITPPITKVAHRPPLKATPPIMLLQPAAFSSTTNPIQEESQSKDEDFPPSISQRGSSRFRSKENNLEDRRTLGLPRGDSSRQIREKRSFDRTKAWAIETERHRNRSDRTSLSSSQGGSRTDDSFESSLPSIDLPRTPSPPPRQTAEVKIAPKEDIISPKPSQALSINEIVRLYSGSADNALSAAKEKARKELGLRAKPRPESAIPVLGKPITPIAEGTTSHIKNSPSMSSSAKSAGSSRVKVRIIPDRDSSMESPTFLKELLPLIDLTGPTFTQPLQPTSLGTPPVQSRPISLQPDPSPSTITPLRNASPTPTHSIRSPTPSQPSTSKPNLKARRSEIDHNMALHLRSSKLNHTIRLPKQQPHNGLKVSYAEVGKLDGYSVVIFLGVGCVRYLIAIYDEIARIFGLRLICIDRWGYGKTDQVDQCERGAVEWTGVVGQVLKHLKIDRFQIVAHSAGVPYAMALARRYPDRVRGRIHLLAPWVGQDPDSGSKWIKWIPEFAVKTVTATDYRIQSYFLGKAPKLNYAPISFDVRQAENPLESPTSPISPLHSPFQSEILESESTLRKSPSIIKRASGIFSSNNKQPRSRSIYGIAAAASSISLALPTSGLRPTSYSQSQSQSQSSSQSQFQLDDHSVTLGRSPALRNIRSLVNNSTTLSDPPSFGSSAPTSNNDSSRRLITPDNSQSIPPSTNLDFGLSEGFDSFETDLKLALPSENSYRNSAESKPQINSTISSSGHSRPGLPLTHTLSSSTVEKASSEASSSGLLPSDPDSFPTNPSFFTAIGRASHAECEPGTTSDILRIVMNKPYRAMGFRYEDVEIPTHIWIGSEDRLISAKSIDWMREKCKSTVETREGVGHNLMSNAGVIMDLFRVLGQEARDSDGLGKDSG